MVMAYLKVLSGLTPMVSLEFLIDIILPAGTMILVSTQPLTEMSTRNISWRGKGGRCVGLPTLPPSCVDCRETSIPNLLESLWPVQACNGIALSLPLSMFTGSDSIEF